MLCFEPNPAEGIAATSRAEFATLKAKQLLNANTTIIHGTAFTSQEFGEKAAVGATLVWSPQSHLALYGETTNIMAAVEAGVTIARAKSRTTDSLPRLSQTT